MSVAMSKPYYQTHEPPHCPTCDCGADPTTPGAQFLRSQGFGRSTMLDELIQRLREGCALRPSRWSGDTHADLGGSVDEPATDAVMAEAADALESLRNSAPLMLLADIRFACGDNGLRMQDELVEYIRELAADAERLDWLASEAPTLWGSRDRGGYELPCFDITSGRECCDPGDLRAAIDQARGKAGNASD